MKEFLGNMLKLQQWYAQLLQVMERLKQENTSLKQANNTQQLRFDKAVENQAKFLGIYLPF
jgi:HPt (histidine-containing phosphotransfer) domain-containing protein